MNQKHHSAPLLGLVLFLALADLPLTAQLAPAPATSSEVESRLELLGAELAAAYLREAQVPFEAKFQELDAKYDTALERALETSNRAGRLEESLALRDERQRVGNGEGVPTVDGDKDPDGLRQLRATYRAELRKLEAERDLAAAPLLAAHDAKLETFQKELTTQGKLDEALLVKGAREKVSERLREDLAPKPAAVASTTPVPMTTPAPPSSPAAAPTVASTPEVELLQWLGTVQLEHASGQVWTIDNREFLHYDEKRKRAMRVSSIIVDSAINGFKVTLHDKRVRLVAFEDDRKFFRISEDGGATFTPPVHQVRKRDDRLFGPPPSPPTIPADFAAWVRTRQFVHGVRESVIWSSDDNESLKYSIMRKEVFRSPLVRVDPETREIVWRLPNGKEEAIRVTEDYLWFDVREQKNAEPVPQPFPIEARDPAIFGEAPEAEPATPN